MRSVSGVMPRRVPLRVRSAPPLAAAPLIHMERITDMGRRITTRRRRGIMGPPRDAIGTISGCGTDMLGRFREYRPATEADEQGPACPFCNAERASRLGSGPGPERALPDRGLPFILSLV